MIPTAAASATARIPATARSSSSRAAVSACTVGSAIPTASVAAATPATSAAEGAPTTAATIAMIPSAIAAALASCGRTPGARGKVTVAPAMPETPDSAASERQRIEATAKPKKRAAFASYVPTLNIVSWLSEPTSGMARMITFQPVYVVNAPVSAGRSAIQNPASEGTPVAERRRAIRVRP
ncbi:MAG: hypothetical protein QM820_13555 [Minicystis sp.]